MNRKAVKSATLPEGWREVKLGDVGKIMTGTTPPTKETQYYKNGTYPFVTPTDIDTRRIISNTERYLTDSGVKKGRLVPKGSLLVTCIASIGKNAILDSEGSCNQQINAIIPAEGYSLEYLYYLLDGNSAYLIKFAGKSATHIINKTSFSNLQFVIPPLPEQKAIASLLGIWDTAIEKTESLIAAKQKQFKWLLKTLISDQQDNPDWRKEKLGEVLGNQLMIKKGKMLTKEQMNKGNYPVVAGGQTYAAYHNKYTHDMKTITISSSGAYAGFVWFHDYPIFATDCNVITVTSGVIEYFYYAIKTQQSRLYGLQSGGAQPHIYAKDIAVLDVVIPPIKRQKKIVYTLKSAQQEINLLKQLAEKYRTQKRGLMQKLLTGKWQATK